MTSSILPNNRATVLPITPTDGQRFVDAQMVQWIYDSQEGIWEKRGTTDDLPLATLSQAGLLSPQDKNLIDGTPAVGGGFGIITDAKLLLQSPTNPEGVITGDIKLKSESLDITCISSNQVKLDCVSPPTICSYGESEETELPGLQFKLSDKFLDTLIVDVRGPTGKTGFTGDKGAKGEPGLSEGPQGDQGIQGDSTSDLCTLDEIRYKDIDGITDTPIVGLNLVDDDGHGCKLIVTKAKVNAEDGRPADKVITTSLSRSVLYGEDPSPSVPPDPTDPEPIDPEEPTDPPPFIPYADRSSTCSYTRLDNWTLAKPAGDPSPLNLQLLRLSKGSNEVIDNPVGFNGTMTLEGFVGEVVAEYKDRLEKVDEQWGKQVREYVNGLDDKARTILSELANDLSMCEFDLPAVEYCITFVECDNTYFSTKLQADYDPGELSGTKVTTIGTMGNRDWNIKL